MLPHSLKGYELYSWQEQDLWHFTLITGTNRTKTIEEVISGENVESEDGWVRIHVIGISELKNILVRLPNNEHVFWGEGQRLVQAKQGDIKITLPPSDIIDRVMEYAEQCGLDLFIARQ